MPAQVYVFLISCEELEDAAWRRIQFSSNYRLDQLAYYL